MLNRFSMIWRFGLFALVTCAAVHSQPAAPLGIFDHHADIGAVLHAGAASFDATRGVYTVTGSGENMWVGHDEFHFVWKKLSGDVALSADIAFLGDKGSNHRKAVLMIRQSLDSRSPAVDVARHGNGLTALQFRDAEGADTREIESNVSAPQRLRLEKRGDFFYAFVSGQDGKLHPTGASIKLAMHGDFYVGIGVCAHDKNATETALFSNVKLQQLTAAAAEPKLYSTLETVSIASTDRRVVYTVPAHFEAPNWLQDGSSFLFNQEGHIYRLPVAGGEPALIPTGFATHCNNDHGISPDGKSIAISDQTKTGKSIVYTLPITGGEPKQITMNSPSYWHGWSPDGKTLAYTAERGGNFDIYSIPVNGGEETRLTSAPGLDDGPEYSPDGQWIYFNSERTGTMQIWRMRADGSQQQQVTFSETNDWFPHLSPDGKWMVYVAYEKGVSGHPPNKDVTLRLMSLADRKVSILATLFGGQGTMNVPSWSPDSNELAFVSYQLLPEGPRD